MKDDPAFPLSINLKANPGEFASAPYIPGLTKRELFAAMAMQACIGHDVASLEFQAKGWVCYANALIAELEKK